MPLDQVDVDQLDGRERGEMSFFEHVDQLRGHILRSVAAVFVFAIVAFIFKDWIFEKVLFGPRWPDFPTFGALCWLGEKVGMTETLCIKPSEFKLFSREMGEFFMVQMTVSFWIGVICAFPYLIWEVWRFIAPGLYEHERRAASGVIFVCSALFLLGVLFGYYIIAPFSIAFLASVQIKGAENTATLSSYVEYMTMFTVPMGLIFELPVISFFLSRVGILGPKFMREYRRYAIVVILIIAAIITPPDWVSQLLVAAPLLLLYEVSIGVSARVVRKRELAEQAASGAPRLPQ